jgi:hypothetical protein
MLFVNPGKSTNYLGFSSLRVGNSVVLVLRKASTPLAATRLSGHHEIFESTFCRRASPSTLLLPRPETSWPSSFSKTSTVNYMSGKRIIKLSRCERTIIKQSQPSAQPQDWDGDYCALQHLPAPS